MWQSGWQKVGLAMGSSSYWPPPVPSSPIFLPRLAALCPSPCPRLLAQRGTSRAADCLALPAVWRFWLEPSECVPQGCQLSASAGWSVASSPTPALGPWSACPVGPYHCHTSRPTLWASAFPCGTCHSAPSPVGSSAASSYFVPMTSWLLVV